MARRVLVTGGAGFIGSHVADGFLELGDDVVVLDNLSSGRRQNLSPAVEFHELDVTSERTATLVREREFDIICHLAAQIDVRKSVADPLADARINVLGTVNLLEAVRAAGTRARFVFASTGGAIYGDFVTPPSVETFAKDPESPYGIAKLSAEHYLAYYGRVHRLETVVLRYANVFGPRQDPHGEAGVVAIFCNRILAAEPLTVFGDGRQTRDYIHVGDVARANLAAASARLPAAERLDARAFNIGTGIETSVLELAEAMRRASGSSVAVRHAPARPGEQQRSAVDIDKARRILGWEPTVALSDGLTDTYAWFAAQRARQPA